MAIRAQSGGADKVLLGLALYLLKQLFEYLLRWASFYYGQSHSPLRVQRWSAPGNPVFFRLGVDAVEEGVIFFRHIFRKL